MEGGSWVVGWRTGNHKWIEEAEGAGVRTLGNQVEDVQAYWRTYGERRQINGKGQGDRYLFWY